MDLPLEHRAKRRFCGVLAIIPGPGEPSYLGFVLRLVATEFISYGPGTSGLPIKMPVVDEATGIKTEQMVPHRMFLTSVTGDAPALAKCCQKMAHNAKKCCLFCGMEGVYIPSQVCMLGYNSEANVWAGALQNVFDAYTNRDNGDSNHTFPCTYQFKVAATAADIGDAEAAGYNGPRFSRAQQRERAWHAHDQVERMKTLRAQLADGDALTPTQKQAIKADIKVAEANLEKTGLHGRSPLDDIFYFNPSTCYVVASMHAALLGVCKSVLNKLFAKGTKSEAAPWYAFKKDARATMADRGENFKKFAFPHDINRPYRCVVNERGFWTIEDYLHFITFLSDYVLYSDPALPEDLFSSHYGHMEWDGEGNPIRAMFNHLRDAMVHYMLVPKKDEWTEAARLKARNHLVQFAQLAEKIFGPKFCTYNLHVLVCQLWHQEAARGPVAYDREVFIERMMQLLKSRVHARAPVHVAAVVARNVTERAHAVVLQDEFPDECITMEQLLQAGMDEDLDESHDEADDNLHCLLGRGKSVSECTAAYGDNVVKMVRTALYNYSAWNTSNEGMPAWVQGKRLAQVNLWTWRLHLGACRAGLEIIWSHMYHKSRSRISHYCEVVYEETVRLAGQARPVEQSVHYIALIKCFVALTGDGNIELEPKEHIRLAIADLYRLKSLLPERLHSAGRMRQPTYRNYAIPMSDLSGKMIRCNNIYALEHQFLAYDVCSLLPFNEGL